MVVLVVQVEMVRVVLLVLLQDIPTEGMRSLLTAIRTACHAPIMLTVPVSATSSAYALSAYAATVTVAVTVLTYMQSQRQDG